MKLLNAHIYGFGKWVDYHIVFPNDSFVCIYGENESGKTTLQQFIMFILFGLSPKQRAFYYPKTSSKMGGRLTIYDSEIGEYTIERNDGIQNGRARCLTKSGNEYGEKWLNSRLNGVSKPIYESIYSFDANSLSAIEHMSQGEIVEVLLGVGLTGSEYIYNVEKSLNAELEELFKPYGKLPIINKQLEEMDQLSKMVTDYKQEESTYYDKNIKLIKSKEEKEILQNELLTTKKSIYDNEKILQALPHIKNIVYYRRKMKQLPQNHDFPEQGMERLANLKRKILPLQSEQTILTVDEQKYMDEKGKLLQEIDSYSISELNNILSLRGLFSSNEQELNKIITLQRELNKELEDRLNILNIGLSKEDVHVIELPFYTEKMWSDLKELHSTVTIEEEKLSEEEQSIKDRQLYLNEQISMLKDEVTPLAERKQLEQDLSIIEEEALLQKMSQTINNTQSTLKVEKNQFKKHEKITIIVTSILSFLSVLAFLVLDRVELGYMSLIIILAGYIIWIREKHNFKNMEEIIKNQTSQENRSLLTTEDQRQIRVKLENDNEIKNDLKIYKDQSRDIKIQLLQLDEKRTSLTYKRKRLEEKINEQIEINPYLSEINVEFWPDAFHAFKHLLRLVRDNEKHFLNQENIEAKQLKIRKQVEQLIQIYSLSQTSQSVESQFEQLDSLLKVIQEKEARITQLTEFIADYSHRKETVTSQINTIQLEINKLFSKANVSDEDSFYKIANEIDEIHELNNLIDEITRQYMNVFSTSEWTQLIDNMPKYDVIELEKNKKEVNLKIIEKQLDIVRQTISDVNTELLSMEKKQSYSHAMHQLDRSKDNLNELAQEWAVLKTAIDLLSTAKWRFQDKYLKRIIEQTTVYFKALTKSYYINVYTPKENKPFLVEGHDHIRYTVNELSKGTMHQLYISLRLAISEVMNEPNQFPFIMDDAFVHFDAVRTKRLLTILRKQSESQQTILFTCKQDIASQFSINSIIEL